MGVELEAGKTCLRAKPYVRVNQKQTVLHELGLYESDRARGRVLEKGVWRE